MINLERKVEKPNKRCQGKTQGYDEGIFRQSASASSSLFWPLLGSKNLLLLADVHVQFKMYKECASCVFASFNKSRSSIEVIG